MSWIDGALRAFGAFSLQHLLVLVVLGVMGLAGITLWRNGRTNGQNGLKAQVEEISTWRTRHEAQVSEGWATVHKLESGIQHHTEEIKGINDSLRQAMKENTEAHGQLLADLGEVKGKLEILVSMVSE